MVVMSRHRAERFISCLFKLAAGGRRPRVEAWVASPEPAVGVFTPAGTCQGSAQTAVDGPGRCAHYYGSGGCQRRVEFGFHAAVSIVMPRIEVTPLVCGMGRWALSSSGN